MARPGGFEPPTAWFVARYSIQLSYGRASLKHFFLKKLLYIGDGIKRGERLHGATGRIRTSDRLVRSQVLYPAELLISSPIINVSPTRRVKISILLLLELSQFLINFYVFLLQERGPSSSASSDMNVNHFQSVQALNIHNHRARSCLCLLAYQYGSFH